MSTSVQQPHQMNDVNFNDDTLDMLFNKKDGILAVSEETGADPSQADVIYTPDAPGLSDIDLDALLNSSYEEQLNGSNDIFEEILGSPKESSASPGDDSSLGSPPFIPPSTPAVADFNVVSQDHTYFAPETAVCDFGVGSDEDTGFASSHTQNSDQSSPHVDIPLYIGDDLDNLEARQRSAPGPIRHGRRSRGSNSSGSGLPYTIHDIQVLSGSPSSDSYMEEEGSRTSNSSRYKSDDACFGSPGERLILSDEERFLLAKEGMDLPDRLPLTREEERVLRTVRRKIRNKISAKNSRLKKQEYVVGLEERVKLCSKENRTLRGSVDSLRSQNRQLVTELRRLKQWISERIPGGTGGPLRVSGAAKAGLYTLFLSFALVLTPMLSPFWPSEHDSAMGTIANKPSVLPGRTRALLQERDAAVDVGDPYHITVRPAGLPWQNPPKTAAISLPHPQTPSTTNSVPQTINETAPKVSENNEESLEEEADLETRGEEL